MPLPYIFMQGLLIGFSIAAPVGPIGILCIQRNIRYGKIAGIISGLGAASADAFYGAAAAFGLAVVSGILLSDHTSLCGKVMISVNHVNRHLWKLSSL